MKKQNINFSILDAVNSYNQNRPLEISKKIINLKKYNKNSKLAIFGLSFKPNTDDIRDSTSLKLAQHLFDQGIMINCYDPVSNDNAMNLFPKFNYYKNVYEASEAVDAIIIEIGRAHV